CAGSGDPRTARAQRGGADSPLDRAQHHVVRYPSLGEPVGRRRKAPVLRLAYQSLAARVVVEVVELRLPERLALDLDGVAGRLPEPAVAVLGGGAAQGFAKAGRQVLPAVIGELPAGELPEVGQRPFHGLGLEANVENDGVEM